MKLGLTLILLLFVANCVLLASPSLAYGSNPVNWISHDLDYNHKDWPFPIDPDASGTAEGEKCNPANPNIQCSGDLECVEEKLEAKWGDAPTRCYFRRACQSGDKSPRQACFDNCTGTALECSTQCGGKPTECTYESNCLFSYFVPRPEDNVIVMGCEDHNECASGYCHTVEDLPGATATGKVCMPYSKCTRPCKNYGESVSHASDYCCMGLEPNGSNVCINPAMEVPELPDDIEVLVNDQICQPSLYEIVDGERVKDPETDQDDKNIVAKKYWSYERFLLGLEWLWAHSNSTGTNDYFGVNKLALEVGKHLKEKRNEAENKYAQNIKRMKELEKELLEIKTEHNAHTSAEIRRVSESSAGVQFLKLLATEHEEQVAIHQHKVEIYGEVIGKLAELLVKVKNPEISAPGHHYGRYGSKKSVVYCQAWPPHCWFSKNICGTYFQKNKVCAKELVWVDGIGDQDRVLDPLFPTILLSPPTFSYEWFREKLINVAMYGTDGVFPKAYADLTEGEQWIATAGTVAAVAAFPYGTAAAVIVGVIDIFSNLNYEIPSKIDMFKNKRELLVERIRHHYEKYANTILDSEKGSEKSYNQQNNILNVNAIVHKDEFKLKIKETSPSISDEELQKMVDSLDEDTRRDLVVDLISEMAAYALASYSGSSNNEYKTDRSGRVEKDYTIMTRYLQLYHGKAMSLHTQMAACLRNMAQRWEQKYSAPFAIRDDGGTAEDVSNVAASVANTVDPSNQTDCVGGNCPEGQTFNSQSFGNSVNIGNGGQETGVNIKGGTGDIVSTTGRSGQLGGDPWSARLTAAKQKRINERQRLKKLLGKDVPYDGSRILRNFAAIDGSKSLIKKMAQKTGKNYKILAADKLASSVAGQGVKGAAGVDKDFWSKKLKEMRGGKKDKAKSKAARFVGVSGVKFSTAGRRAAGHGVSQRRQGEMLKSIKKDKKKYQSHAGESLFTKISKAYINYGFPRLFKLKERP